MSEHRHWLSIEHGHVESVEVDDHTELDFYVQRQDKYTEVQVVPLDAIVIRREELPEVRAFGASVGTDGPPSGTSGSIGASAKWAKENAWYYARAYAAIAEHVEAHPPVDEEQVKALSDLLSGIAMEDTREDARYLVQRGVRVVDEP